MCAWWFANVGLNWSPEKMRSLGSILHVCAWGLPAGQTVAALVRRDVDSDDLTGKSHHHHHRNIKQFGMFEELVFIRIS